MVPKTVRKLLLQIYQMFAPVPFLLQRQFSLAKFFSKNSVHNVSCGLDNKTDYHRTKFKVNPLLIKQPPPPPVTVGVESARYDTEYWGQSYNTFYTLGWRKRKCLNCPSNLKEKCNLIYMLRMRL